MIDRYYIGWVRDEKGSVLFRPRKDIANAITTMAGGGIPVPTASATPHRM